MLLGITLLLLGAQPTSALDTFHYDRRKNHKHSRLEKRQGDDDRSDSGARSLDGDWEDTIPFRIANECEDTIWPAILTQAGAGPDVSGFALGSGKDRLLWSSKDWAGRIWGRTNCTVNGESASCSTGECEGKLNCKLSGRVPVTLAEMTLKGGINQDQTFYDISLVDGYNLPIAIKHIPARNASRVIPPNLTNLACIATSGWLWDKTPVGTVYTSDKFPVPWELRVDNENVRRWCPWDDLAFPPEKPGDGVFPYPDDDVPREAFSPCLSDCARTRDARACCTGKYHDPAKCKPGLYSRSAKAVCPDAYSFAFDDHTSTFTVPSGGGFEVIFCPRGRSTNILDTLGAPLSELAAAGELSEETLRMLSNESYVREQAEEAAASGLRPGVLAVSLALGIWLAMA